jgi:hypothetical protein
VSVADTCMAFGPSPDGYSPTEQIHMERIRYSRCSFVRSISDISRLRGVGQRRGLVVNVCGGNCGGNQGGTLQAGKGLAFPLKGLNIGLLLKGLNDVVS